MDFIRIQWLHADTLAQVNGIKMEFQLAARDEEVAWRLFRRLCDVLRALVNVEGRREEARP